MTLREEPQYRVIMRIIEERIRSGAYSMERAIPGERVLAREFGTNHETVNKAVSNLVASGLLYRKRGVGTFISKSSYQKKESETRKRIDILVYKKAEELFNANSFHEEIMFVLQNELILRGSLSRIIPVKDLADFRDYIAGVDAVIASRFLPLRLLRIATEQSKPIVCLNFEYAAAKTSCLIIDNSAIDSLVEHLVSLGHRNIAFAIDIGFNVHQESRRVRFLRAMELHELEKNFQRVYAIDPSDEDISARFIRMIENCTAVMAADDVLAVRLRTLFSRFGKQIPKDISLTGFGNLSLAQKIYPTLTTTDINRDHFCAAVVEEVLWLLSGAHGGRIQHFSSFPVIGNSTGPVALKLD